MSVMTAGEQRHRAGAARGRQTMAVVPGQPNVTAGPWPGAGEPRGGAVHGRPWAGWPGEAGARQARTRVRLTRRGRIVVAALITMGVVLVAALAWLAGTARADAAGSGVPSSAVYHSLRSVTVMPGQSLWSIATRYDPAADPRGVIQQIIDLNALSGTSVQPGQHLWLPRG
jgi:LysM domain